MSAGAHHDAFLVPIAEHPALKPAAASSRRILVVDDSATMRLILRRILEGAGHCILEARDGIAALELLERERFDVMTLDVDMPGISGFEVCSQLRHTEQACSRTPLPVVFLTSHDTLVDRRMGFSLGAADFIAKPIDESELLSRIDRLLGCEQRLQGLTALVVEDSRATRNIVCSCLRQTGLAVLEAEDGETAYRILQERGETVDLLITDFDMPGMDGKELCMKTRRELGRPWMPIIFLSGLSEMSYVLEMFAAGATDYITKPFTKEELIARISVHVEIRRLNQERRRQIDELAQLNKLKDSLLAIASHDLRAPLNGILGFANLLSMDRTLNAENAEYVQGIRESGAYLLHMINDVLELAKLESHASELSLIRCDLNAVIISSLRSLVHMAAPKGLVILHESPGHAAGSPLWIDGDRNGLLRIVNNLVSNAIKFTQPGGTIRIRTHDEDSYVCLEIIDTGIGIPPERLPSLFRPFSGFARKGTAGESGTGLGLSIVRQLADSHGARILVQSEPGKGTTISLRFPRARSSASEPLVVHTACVTTA